MKQDKYSKITRKTFSASQLNNVIAKHLRLAHGFYETDLIISGPKNNKKYKFTLRKLRRKR